MPPRHSEYGRPPLELHGSDGPPLIEDPNDPAVIQRRALSMMVDRKLEAEEATKGARAIIARAPSEMLRWPYEALHRLTNVIPPEEFWIWAAMSGHGKTTAMMSVFDKWVSQGIPCAYVGLEMSNKVLKIHWACRRMSARGIFLHPGDVLKGKLHPENTERLRDADILTQALHDELAFITREYAEIGRLVPVSWLTADNAQRICEQAANFGVKALFIDHLEQFDSEEGLGRSEYEEHKRLIKKLHGATRRWGVSIIGLAQMGTDFLRRPGGMLRQYQPPSLEMVIFGMLKRQNCDAMLGGYKTLPAPPDGREEAEAYRAAMKILRDDPQRVAKYLVQNTMAVSNMKDRAYGKEGDVDYLGVEYSRIVDADPAYQKLALDRLLSLASPRKRKKDAEPAPADAGAPAPPTQPEIPWSCDDDDF